MQAQPVVGPTWGGGNELTIGVQSPPPKPLISAREWPASLRPEFLRLPPEELARQLTLIGARCAASTIFLQPPSEHDLFRVIPPWELLGMGWMKSDKTVRYALLACGL